MRTLVKRFPYMANKSFNLYPIGDIHLGSAGCDEELLEKTVKQIASDPDGRVVLMGDMIDGIGRANGDKRNRNKTLATWARQVEDEDELFEAEVAKAVEVLSPIADKLLAVVCGNHEDDVERHGHGNVYWQIVDRLAVIGGHKAQDIALGYDGFIPIRFDRQVKDNKPHVWTLTLFVHHGFGGGKMPGAKALNLWHMLGTYDADIVLVGHTHDHVYTEREIVSPGNGTPKQKTRVGVVCGSFLKGYIEPSKRGRPREMYSERFGMPVLRTGHPVITIDPGREKFSVTHHIGG